MRTDPSTLADAVVDRLRQAAALALWQHEAVRVDLEEPFRLASGNRSPIYVNCRRPISDPAFLGLFAAAARALLARRAIDPDVVAGGETAGIPYAAILAVALGKPLVYVRKQAKGHGLANRVEGAVEPGARVLLVEDLITDGGSKLGFLDALAEAGARVENALVLFDRQQGGDVTLAARGVALAAVTDRATALAVGVEAGLLSAAERDEVETYFRDPADWHRRRGLDWKSSDD